MNLRDKAQKYLEENKRKKSPTENKNETEEDWINFKENLSENIQRILNKHSSNI